MKYKIHYKSLDSITNKEFIINRIKEFYKNKYHLEQTDFDTLTRFLWKEYLPGFGTNAKDAGLLVHWEDRHVHLYEDGVYKPFTKKELKFFDSLDFELYKEFADVVEQDITDWVGMKDEI
jgi:hypothetical protein